MQLRWNYSFLTGTAVPSPRVFFCQWPDHAQTTLCARERVPYPPFLRPYPPTPLLKEVSLQPLRVSQYKFHNKWMPRVGRPEILSFSPKFVNSSDIFSGIQHFGKGARRLSAVPPFTVSIGVQLLAKRRTARYQQHLWDSFLQVQIPSIYHQQCQLTANHFNLLCGNCFPTGGP